MVSFRAFVDVRESQDAAIFAPDGEIVGIAVRGFRQAALLAEVGLTVHLLLVLEVSEDAAEVSACGGK